MASYTLHIQYVDRPAETRTFTQAKVSLGRDSGDIVLHDTQVSGKHGEILFDGSTLRYTDVGSTNGSFLLQGQRVANIELTPGIALRLGNSLITVQVIDAPNVAGKGRTVIAGPGMAPGFPAPMRPPGGAPMTAPAPGGAVPRPGMPFPAPPAGPAPGAFAFAPTAQMQSPVAPGAAPGMPAPQPFTHQPPAPMAPQPAPMAPQYPAPPQHLAPPQPTPPTQPPISQLQPVQAVPQASPMAPPPGTYPPRQPLSQPPGAMPMAPLQVPEHYLPTPVADDSPDLSPPGKIDIVGAATAAWRAIEPHILPAALVTAIVSVPMAVLGWLVLITLGGTTFGGLLLMLLALVQFAATLIVFPALIRFVLGVHLGQPIDIQDAIKQQVADIINVGLNFLVFGLVAGVAAIFLVVPALFVAAFIGPIYFVEGKRMFAAITRNVDLVKRDWIPVVVHVLVVAVLGAIALGIVGAIFAVIPAIGGLLGALLRAVGQSILSPIVLMMTTQMYFQWRRRFEGGDPEAEARERLGTAALPMS